MLAVKNRVTRTMSRHKMSIALAVVATVGFGMEAHGVETPSVPSFSSTGSYSVTFYPYSQYNWLEESQGSSGMWSTVAYSDYAGPTPVAITGKADGTYHYRSVSAYLICDPYYGCYDVWYEYSGQASVTVATGPAPTYEDLDVQSQYQYQVRSGDINGDGRQDIYVQRTAGGNPNNGVLKETILQQLSNHTFAVFAASSAQLNAAANWPVLPVVVKQADMNFDGYMDLAIRALGSYVYGVNDQLVYSTGVPYSGQASAVTAIDSKVVHFFRDLGEWMTNENYFNAAIIPELPGYNIKIVVGIEYCDMYYFYCLGYGTDLINLGNFSLQELGLADIINTTSQQVDARISVSDEASAAQYPYIDYYCVWYCGESWIYGYYYDYWHFYWYDMWTPVTVGGGFDSTNYSLDAYNVSVVIDKCFDTGEDSVTPSEVDAVEVVVGGVLGQVVIDIPYPGDIPNDDVKPKAKKGMKVLGWLTWLIVSAEALNDVIRDVRPIFHYATPAGEIAIKASGQIINPAAPAGGPVWFTYLAYPNSLVAQELLALCDLRSGYFIIKQSSLLIPVQFWTPVSGKTCPDGTHKSGGGWETIVPSPVSALPIRFVPIRPTW